MGKNQETKRPAAKMDGWGGWGMGDGGVQSIAFGDFKPSGEHRCLQAKRLSWVESIVKEPGTWARSRPAAGHRASLWLGREREGGFPMN